MSTSAYSFRLSEGACIPRDNGYLILAALSRQHPFLHGRYDVQIAPVRGTRTRTNHGLIVTDRSSILHIRGLSPDEIAAVRDTWIRVEGALIHVQDGEAVKLGPSSRLVSYLVVLPDVVVKPEFEEQVKALVEAPLVTVGRRRAIRVKGRHFLGHSVLLEGLGDAEALRIQERGLGKFTSMGCGVFYPGSRAVG